MEPCLLYSVTDGIATVMIHNPAKRNAMTYDMWRELPPLLDKLTVDPHVRALVLTGDGDTFCAGADIGSLIERGEESQGLAVSAEEALAMFPKPTLAAVRGYCVGGGCQLATACDLRFTTDDSAFGITPAKLGIVYSASSTARLVSLVGPATAKHLLFSAELINAQRAHLRGLVDEVFAPEDFDHEVARFARVLASRSQLTQAAAKEFAAGPTDPERTAYWSEQARTSDDTVEAVTAFLEHRAPRFSWTLPAS